MEFSPSNLLSPKEVLSEVLIYTQEMGYNSVTRGFIISQMNRCMQALSYDTFFNEQHIGFNIPENGLIDIPAGAFNINQMYLYSGDSCNIGTNTANVYWKRNMYTGGGTGFAARNKGNNGNGGKDPFYSGNREGNNFNRRGSGVNGSSKGISARDGLYYYGISNGQITLSENTGNYSKILIKFNGIWEVDAEKKTIPQHLQEVLVDWCTEAVFRVKEGIDPAKWGRAQLKAEIRLGYKPETFGGSWYKALRRVTSMDSKSKEDLKEYLSRLNY
jgi:hypothetical protein